MVEKATGMGCRGAIIVLILCALAAAGGCGEPGEDGVWYKWGKTLVEADDDCRACYYEAVKYARDNSKPYMGYAPENEFVSDYRDSYAMRGHGVGEDMGFAGSRGEQLLSRTQQYSYSNLRQRQMARCMKDKGYRIRSAKSLGGNLAKMEVPVAGDHWVAGIRVADANSDPNDGVAE